MVVVAWASEALVVAVTEAGEREGVGMGEVAPEAVGSVGRLAEREVRTVYLMARVAGTKAVEERAVG